jgi:N-acetylglucosaminyl-diphospho-decaprenol L-rhamnosyltransferase
LRLAQTSATGGAANVGVARTSSDFVVISNPDVIWSPGSLDELVTAADRWPHAGSLGPLILTPEGAIYPSARAIPVARARHRSRAVRLVVAVQPVGRNVPSRAGRTAGRPAGWLSGLLVRCAAFNEIDGFDPSYFMYFEDVDLGERLGRPGWQNVYVPSAAVTNTGGHATSRDASRMVAEHHRGAWTYLSTAVPRSRSGRRCARCCTLGCSPAW